MTLARDDRVLPETRALGVFIVPFLLVAFPLLYFFADFGESVHDWPTYCKDRASVCLERFTGCA